MRNEKIQRDRNFSLLWMPSAQWQQHHHHSLSVVRCSGLEGQQDGSELSFREKATMRLLVAVVGATFLFSVFVESFVVTPPSLRIPTGRPSPSARHDLPEW